MPPIPTAAARSQRGETDREIDPLPPVAAFGGGAFGARLLVGKDLRARRIGEIAAGLLDRRHATSLGRSRCARSRGVQLMPDVQAKLGEARIGAHRVGVARPSERHVEHLLDAAGTRAHHRDPIAEQDRLVDRMGDEHHGLALVGPFHERKQLLLQDLAGLRVECRERLIHQQDRRVHGERAHQPHALLHSAGQLVGIMALEAGEPDHVQIMCDPRADFGARHARHGQSESAIVVDGLPRQQPEMLEHHGDAVGRRVPPPACHGPGACRCSDSVRPAMQRNSVVLPQPDGPTTHMISLRLTASDSW